MSRGDTLRVIDPSGEQRPCAIGSDLIPTTFNIFMNVDVAPDGTLNCRPAPRRATTSICAPKPT
jgi:uncharacterized protein YcgI (DUF1989 family)